MNTFLLLFRGINVGGKNKVSMAELKQHLEEFGYENVKTYINSGNIIVSSGKNAKAIKQEIESSLLQWFKLDSSLIKVLVLNKDQLASIIESKPSHFGDEPQQYHSDVIFLIDLNADDAFRIFTPREGVDAVWKGNDVVYSRRLSAERTKSRLGKIIASPLYKSMTIRSWNTTIKLYEIMNT